MGAQDDHDQSRALSQLCSMIVEILKSPSWPPWLWLRSLQQLLRHCSLEFPWLFGSVTFVIGFVLSLGFSVQFCCFILLLLFLICLNLESPSFALFHGIMSLVRKLNPLLPFYYLSSFEKSWLGLFIAMKFGSLFVQNGVFHELGVLTDC